MFEATDGVKLSGMLFAPRRKTRRVVIFLHGTGGASVFDSRRTNRLGDEFIRRRVAWFPFNNRGAHIVRRAGENSFGGMAFEKIRECVYDIDGAIREMWRRGYREIYLVGHSTGANKVAVYNALKPRNRVRAYVMLAGGDDTGLMYDQLGSKFRTTLARAREKIHNGEAHHFVPDALSDTPMTWRAFYDVSNPDGDYNVFPYLEARKKLKLSRKPLFHHVRTIRKPMLVVYGENDEYSDDIRACVAVLADAVADRPNIEIVVMKDADHGFSGKEEELAELLAGWFP
jgi:pimeloyl-ACP methyl ester carboxylesterase